MVESSLIVDEEENWFAANLDGLIDSETMLKISCPTQKKQDAHNSSQIQMIKSSTCDISVYHMF